MTEWQRMLIFTAGTIGLSVIVTGVAIHLARRYGLLAKPVSRSSHTTPTPQVGGVGISLTFVAGLLVLPLVASSGFFSEVAAANTLRVMLIAGTLWGFGLGAYDDVHPLSAIPKLFALILMACIPLLFGLSFPLPHASEAVGARILAGVLTAFWVLFFVNAYNFMDGVNGQSGFFALNAILWTALIAYTFDAGATPADEAHRLGPWLWFFLAAGGSILGFLLWNFPWSATFMGDSGSLPVGGMLAIFVLFFGQKSLAHFFVLLLPLSVYIYDVIYTLARRTLRGENLLQAHRSHLYQRMLIASGWSHTRLLVFHLPFYALTGLAGLAGAVILAEHSSAAPPLPWAPIAATAVVLIAYTSIVIRTEKKVRQAETAPE